jgi:hypothetical protein
VREKESPTLTPSSLLLLWNVENWSLTLHTHTGQSVCGLYFWLFSLGSFRDVSIKSVRATNQGKDPILLFAFCFRVSAVPAGQARFECTGMRYLLAQCELTMGGVEFGYAPRLCEFVFICAFCVTNTRATNKPHSLRSMDADRPTDVHQRGTERNQGRGSGTGKVKRGHICGRRKCLLPR